jgi:hypothetical protein
MKQSINFSQFVDAFRAYDRYDSFGYTGLRVIFDYLEQYEQDCNEEIGGDVIAICCDYNMMDIEDIVEEYRIDVSDVDEDDVEQYVLDYLNDHTMVLGQCVDGIVFQCF